MKFNWTVKVPAAYSLAVASVSDGSLDHSTIVAFQSSDCDQKGLANAIREVIAMRNDPEQYMQEKAIDAGSGVMVYKLVGMNCSIVQNHVRVLYHGPCDRLEGLPEAIEKAYAKL